MPSDFNKGWDGKSWETKEQIHITRIMNPDKKIGYIRNFSQGYNRLINR